MCVWTFLRTGLLLTLTLVLCDWFPGSAWAGATSCAGDCDGDGEVSIAELIRAIRIPLGEDPLDDCRNVDVDGNGTVAINELVSAVNNALQGCGGNQPDLITFEHLNLQPEGIEYDAARGRFLVGSRTEGRIYSVDDEGTIAPLVTDPGLSVSLGLHIDRPHGRLLAAGVLSDSGNPALGIYDLASGAPIHVVDLGTVGGPGQHLANDVVSDADGNAYVTDTVTATVYKVDPDGTATIFSAGPELATANGIELYDNRELIVATLTGPSLRRVPLDDPQTIGTVGMSRAVAGDGIVFMADGDLAVVTPASLVLRLHSDDDWQTATVAGSWDASQVEMGATTAAVRGDDVYVVFAHLFQTMRSTYEIARAQFTAPPP
jgi:sugar lactone lactonase YvrE